MEGKMSMKNLSKHKSWACTLILNGGVKEHIFH
jgi:hypothetical protein